MTASTASVPPDSKPRTGSLPSAASTALDEYDELLITKALASANYICLLEAALLFGVASVQERWHLLKPKMPERIAREIDSIVALIARGVEDLGGGRVEARADTHRPLAPASARHHQT